MQLISVMNHKGFIYNHSCFHLSFQQPLVDTLMFQIALLVRVTYGRVKWRLSRSASLMEMNNSKFVLHGSQIETLATLHHNSGAPYVGDAVVAMGLSEESMKML